MTFEKNFHGAAAYGGEGWRPRVRPLGEEIGTIWRSCGIRSEYSPLRAVMVHRPGAELEASRDPDRVQMLAPLDARRAGLQHDAMIAAYREAGVEVLCLDPRKAPPPNLMFAADLVFMTPEGAIVGRPASEVRAGEERLMAEALAHSGVPILRTVSGRGTFEGADAMWLDDSRVLVGCGLRTNAEGVRQVTVTLAEMGVEALSVDLPHGAMHLMGVLRIVDRDLALAWPARLAHAAVEALRAAGYRVAFFPDEGEAVSGQACNFVTLEPRKVLMASGNPNTRRFLESLGVTCRTVAVDELVKAAGGIGCMTAVLARQEQGTAAPRRGRNTAAAVIPREGGNP